MLNMLKENSHVFITYTISLSNSIIVYFSIILGKISTLLTFSGENFALECFLVEDEAYN